MDEVPGGGNWHELAREVALQRSHGGLSLWMHFCFALRHAIQATGFLMARMTLGQHELVVVVVDIDSGL
jgi:hypothetical protein